MRISVELSLQPDLFVFVITAPIGFECIHSVDGVPDRFKAIFKLHSRLFVAEDKWRGARFSLLYRSRLTGRRLTVATPDGLQKLLEQVVRGFGIFGSNFAIRVGAEDEFKNFVGHVEVLCRVELTVDGAAFW